MVMKVAEVALKALAGAMFVLAFAALAQVLSPKRFTGVFSAAPSVALGSLVVTAAFSGIPDVALSARGMAVGAVAFTAYCVAAVPLLHRLGAWRGSLAALGVWGAVAAVGYLVVALVPVNFGWGTHWGLETRLVPQSVIDGGVLLLGAVGFALARRWYR